MHTNKSKHDKILRDLYEFYKDIETENNEFEFCWDGPSDWNLFENEMPKILFLLKEPRQGFHPSIPKQRIENKFGKNIARWKYAIKYFYSDGASPLNFPSDEMLSEFNDDIAIVELKKLNEENGLSSNKEILEYATKDKKLLRDQIEVINPDIIVCCYTFESFDSIYDNNYMIEEKLVQIDNCSSWNVNDRLVIDFYHPSTWQPWIDPNNNDIKLFDTLCKMLMDDKVQMFFENNKKDK